MERTTSFTEGKILQPLILFAFPVLLALFLQAMYGAVDLLIVGKFASSADVSAVSTGSQIMTTLTNLISSFAMGTTILLGQQIGSGKREEGGHTVGTAILLFAGIAVALSVILVAFAPQVSRGDECTGGGVSQDCGLYPDLRRRYAGCPCAGVLSGEYPAEDISVSYRAGDADVVCAAAGFVCGIYDVAE